MDDLAQWLRAQIDEDERIARSATSGPWRDHDTHLGQYGHTATVLSGEGNDTDLRAWLPSMSQESWDETRNVWADAAHIAAHDPARVLREIDAKRQVLDRYVGAAQAVEELATVRQQLHARGQDVLMTELEQESAVHRRDTLHGVLHLLALPYADRPGYLESWRP
jgi:DNA-binding transcriptional regulator YbjK